ncbi:MAG TPA: hypothetical protein VLQ92_13275, partial [Candidatus Limnocylindrales bacterium]|nr:hypothetical protein [Candidatus Limnocylindrales bacterium]
ACAGEAATPVATAAVTDGGACVAEGGIGGAGAGANADGDGLAGPAEAEVTGGINTLGRRRAGSGPVIRAAGPGRPTARSAPG